MKTFALAALVFVAGLGQLAQAGVDVTVFRIEETRTIRFGDDKVSHMPPGMRVLLSLHGPEAESSIRYGKLKLDEAVDDQGNNLNPGQESFNEINEFRDYANSFFRNSTFGGQTKSADPQVELDLAAPKRTATKIARLRGSLTLSNQGTMQTAELPKLKGAGRKTLSLPPEAHLTVTAIVGAGDKVRSIDIETSGDETVLDSLDVVDASGEKISTELWSWGANSGPAHRSIELQRPLDDSMKLVAKFALDRKFTVVSFDLKDIPLP